MTKLKHQKARAARKPPTKAQPSKATFSQQEKRGALLVTAELDKALEECKSRVSQIAKECREKNRKFRCVACSNLFALDYLILDAEISNSILKMINPGACMGSTKATQSMPLRMCNE